MEKEKGYVYILTNPAFREDWVKIGKTENLLKNEWNRYLQQLYLKDLNSMHGVKQQNIVF